MGGKRSRVDILQRTTYHMVKMGFQARQRGYRYLREAVWVAYHDPESLTSVTKLLYPKVAKLFSTTDKQVERAIRNAIETAWTKGNQDALQVFFKDIYGDGSTRPTNSEVIEVLVGFFMDSIETMDST